MSKASRWDLVAGLLALAVTSCSRSPTILVSVEDLPMEAASLHVLPLHAGLGPRSEVAPYELPQPASARSTFLLRLPDSFVGDVTVEVGVYKGAGATSCLLATGSAKLADLQGQDSTLRVPVVPVTDTVCSGTRPLLLEAAPRLGLIDGKETIRLTGWGFAPGAVVQFAGTAAQTTFVSSSQLDAITPSRVAIGPTELKVQNKSGAFHSRSDLFRFYASRIDFGPLPVNPAGSTNEVSDLVISSLVPKIPTAAASLVASFRNDDNLRLIWTIPAQPIPTIDTRTSTFAVGSAPSGITVGDMNGDGITDVVVALSGVGKAQILLNDGAGTLSPEPALTVGTQPEAVAVGDLNGDKKLDIVTANMGNNSLSVVLSNPLGGYLPAIPMATDKGPVGVVITDINRDGILDIVSLQQTAENISVFLGSGLGLFGPKSSVDLVVGKLPVTLFTSDVNRDGIEDLLIVNQNDNRVQVLVNRSKAAINFDTYSLSTGMKPESVAFADVNGDGISDLLVACSGSNTIDVFLNIAPDGLKGTTAQSFKMPSSCINGIRRVAALDVIQDGQLDLVGLCGSGGGIMKNQTL